MDKKFNLSSFKGKVDSTVFLVLFLVLLAALLGVASYFTVKTSMETSDKIKSVNEELEDNYVLIGRLRELKKNSDYYLKQKAEYDKVIADAGTYNSVDYYVELDSLCRKYDLKIEEIKVGEPGARR